MLTTPTLKRRFPVAQCRRGLLRVIDGESRSCCGLALLMSLAGLPVEGLDIEAGYTTVAPLDLVELFACDDEAMSSWGPRMRFSTSCRTRSCPNWQLLTATAAVAGRRAAS
jgi:hypothetical protein